MADGDRGDLANEERLKSFTDKFDTSFCIPDLLTRSGATLVIHLKLNVEHPDVSELEELIDNPLRLDVIAAAVSKADQPYPWAKRHICHAIDHLKSRQVENAWPPLVIGVEGLFWATAEARGLIDTEGKFTPSSGKTGRPRSVNDVLKVLKVNDRVQRYISRYGFGGDGNQMRHGRLHGIDARKQCLAWMIALCAWLDGYGWPARD